MTEQLGLIWLFHFCSISFVPPSTLVGKRRHVFTDALNWKLTGSITLSRQPLTWSGIHAHAWLQGKRQNSCHGFTPGLPRQVRSVSRWRGATVHILQFRIMKATNKKKKEKTQCLLVQRYSTAPRSLDTRSKLPITLKMNISKPPS